MVLSSGFGFWSDEESAVTKVWFFGRWKWTLLAGCRAICGIEPLGSSRRFMYHVGKEAP